MADETRDDELPDLLSEDLGYLLGWVALGATAGDDGCEAARAIGVEIVNTEEMRAIRALLRHFAVRTATEVQEPTRAVLGLLGAPEIVIDWVLS